MFLTMHICIKWYVSVYTYLRKSTIVVTAATCCRNLFLVGSRKVKIFCKILLFLKSLTVMNSGNKPTFHINFSKHLDRNNTLIWSGPSLAYHCHAYIIGSYLSVRDYKVYPLDR